MVEWETLAATPRSSLKMVKGQEVLSLKEAEEEEERK